MGPYTPEQASSADIANVGMSVQSLHQQFTHHRSHLRNICHQILLPDDSLHLEGSGAGDWMALVGLTVSKCAAAFIQSVNDPLLD
jgi:hypothetical protein